MQFPFIYLIVFCLLVILFLVWYIQRTKQRKKFLEQEHKYDQALLEVHAIGDACKSVGACGYYGG